MKQQTWLQWGRALIVAVVTAVVSAAVSYAYSYLVHGEAAADWQTSVVLGITLGVVLTLIENR